MKKILAAILLFSLQAAARAENFNAFSREFYSKNGIYTLKVGYSGQGGGGRARLELRGAAGKKISVFESDRAPFTVTISGDGQRLFFFCGSWGQSVNIYTLDVHSASGELLASHQVQMQGSAGEDFSEDHSVYAFGEDRGTEWNILVLDSEDGALRWKKKFKQKLVGLKLSGSGERLLALFVTGENGRRAVIFDKAGKELWRRELATGNNLLPKAFSGDGSELEIWESRMIYDEKDGYWHDTALKKHLYRFGTDGAEEGSSVKSAGKPK